MPWSKNITKTKKKKSLGFTCNLSRNLESREKVCDNLNKQTSISAGYKHKPTLSAEVVEYWEVSSSYKCPEYNTKLHLKVSLSSWSTLTLILHPGPHRPRYVVHVGILFMGQMEMFNHLIKIIIIGYLKPYSGISIRYEYLINRITNLK